MIPFEAITTFWDYDINSGRPVVFETPPPDSGAKTTMDHESDSLAAVVRSGSWANGRYEIHRPPLDTLESYTAWGDSLHLDLDPQDDQQVREAQAQLATLAEGLPSDVTGIKPGGVNYEAFADIFRYNRVQGPSLGYGYAVKVPGWSFTRAQATLRFGFSDERLTGQLGLVREAPSGRWRLEGYRSIGEVEPFFRVNTFGNTMNGVFAAHDDADYYLAQGGRIGYETSVGRGLELGLQARFEDQQSVSTEARSAINDFLGGSGDFPANPGITEGFFVGLTATLDGVAGTGTWRLGAEGLGGADVRDRPVHGGASPAGVRDARRHGHRPGRRGHLRHPAAGAVPPRRPQDRARLQLRHLRGPGLLVGPGRLDPAQGQGAAGALCRCGPGRWGGERLFPAAASSARGPGSRSSTASPGSTSASRCRDRRTG